MKKNELETGEKIVLIISLVIPFGVGLFYDLGAFLILGMVFVTLFVSSWVLYEIRAKRQNKINSLNKKYETTKKIIETKNQKEEVEIKKYEKVEIKNFDNNVINSEKTEIEKKIEQIKLKNKDRNDNYKYIVDYIDEYQFKSLQRGLKKYNMLAYKKLVFEYYPKLMDGELIGNVVSNVQDEQKFVYELKLPTDKMFAKVHGDITLQYTVYHKEKIILLNTITPTNLLLEGDKSELTTYKGILISKQNSERDKYKIDFLLNILDKK